MSFKISSLVEKTDSFTFVYDEFELTGRYYKYKTSTPNYSAAAIASVPEEVTEGTDAEKKTADNLRTKAVVDYGMRWFADTIYEWNAIDDDGQPVPLTVETFKALPMPFLDALRDHFQELITPKKVEPPNSGSS